MSNPSNFPRRLSGSSASASGPGFLLSGTEFEASFDLELCRSERSRLPLALVVFTPLRGPKEDLEGLLELLAERKRLPDSVGRMPAGAIGVLLPYTDRVGAWSFADAVLQRLGAQASAFRASVSTSDDGVWYDHASPNESHPKPLEPFRHGRGLDDVDGLAEPRDADSKPGRRLRPLPGGGRSAGESAGGGGGKHALNGAGVSAEPETATLLLDRPAEMVAPEAPPLSVARKHSALVRQPSTDIWRHFATPPAMWKRSLDVVASGLALVVLAPIFLLIAALIKITSPGPVFFRQKRAGELGRPFTLLKFRSMYQDAEKRKRELMHLNEMDGPAFKIKNDPRITPLGGFLRRSSLDELPQLVNVFRGEMSLVGPRPPTMDELSGYERWHRRRLSRRGGLTCIWQTSGRNQITFQEWMRMDMRYLRKESLRTDLGLLLKTVWTVTVGRGAS